MPRARATTQLGGSQDRISEAQSYQTLLSFVRAARPFGTEFKQLMRASILRDRLAGCRPETWIADAAAAGSPAAAG